MHQRVKSSSANRTQPKKSHTSLEIEISHTRTSTAISKELYNKMGGCSCMNTTILKSIKCIGWSCLLIGQFTLIVVSYLFLGTQYLYDYWKIDPNMEKDLKSALSIVIPITIAILPLFVVICDSCVTDTRIVREYHVESNLSDTGSVQRHSNREKEALLQQQEIERLSKEVTSLKKSKKAKKDELDTLKQQYDEAETAIISLKDEKRDMETQITDQQETAVEIEKSKEKYKQQRDNLKTEKQTLLDEKQVLNNEKQILEKKNELLSNEKQEIINEKLKYEQKANKLDQQFQRYKQNLEQLQNVNVESKDDEKESIRITELRSEMKNIKLQNNKLKDQLQQQTMGKGIESGFIKEEDFSTQKISPFRQNTFRNLFDDLYEELEEKYEELDVEEEESEEDSKDEIDKVLNEETDTKPKFELLMDRIAYEFLFDLLMLSYEFMTDRKMRICQVVARQLNIESNKEQKAEEIADVMIHPQLQQQWADYLKNKMENVYGIMVDEIDVVIDEIFEKICGNEKYKSWGFLKKKFEKKVKEYIWCACEICWIMILTKPELTFYPSEFRMFVNDKENEYFYNAKDKHDLWTGSKTKDGAKILFFAMPAVVQSHFMNKQKLHIIKGTLFAHNNEELMEYVMSDPEELLEIQS